MAEKKNLLVLDTVTRRLAFIVNHHGVSSQSDHPSLHPYNQLQLGLYDSSTSQNDSYEHVHGDVPSHDVVWRVIASDADSDKEFTDIIYEKAVGEGIAKISINRPERRNVFRPNTVKELIRAFNDARHDSSIGVVILTGKGTKAFCSVGDKALRIAGGYSDNEDISSLNVLNLQNHPAVVVPGFLLV